jgi:hypothetical protein
MKECLSAVGEIPFVNLHNALEYHRIDDLDALLGTTAVVSLLSNRGRLFSKFGIADVRANQKRVCVFVQC